MDTEGARGLCVPVCSCREPAVGLSIQTAQSPEI